MVATRTQNAPPGRNPDDHPDAKLRKAPSPQVVLSNRFSVA